MHYGYLIQSETDPAKRYVGFTDDLKPRLSDHNEGKARHILAQRSWHLVTYLGFSDRGRALAFERYRKVGPGHAFARRHFWNL